MLDALLNHFALDASRCTITPFGSGLINNTWLVEHGGEQYILQRINHSVFSEPQKIADNIAKIGGYLRRQHPDYLFVEPIGAVDGTKMIHDEEHGYFRLFPFVPGSQTKLVVSSAEEAYEAAAQFAKFTRVLSGFRCDELQITLPDFHNLDLRYRQFLQAVANATPERKAKAKQLIDLMANQQAIVEQYRSIISNPNFCKRVTHHDTKISNVLFDENGKGLCVIDLDTVMPGYFISDVGDMMRTYLSPVSEEEKDVGLIEVKEEYLFAITAGYLEHMQDQLTAEERSQFFYAGKFMIYMQAIRFLADYLNNDRYYGQKYEGHNLLRAQNQATLLQRFLEKEAVFNRQMERKLVTL